MLVPVPMNPSMSGLSFLTQQIYILCHVHERAKSVQSCLTLCEPVDCNPPGSSVHGILQTWILKWVAMPSSRGFSQPCDRTCVSCLLHWPMGSLQLVPPGKPCLLIVQCELAGFSGIDSVLRNHSGTQVLPCKGSTIYSRSFQTGKESKGHE